MSVRIKYATVRAHNVFMQKEFGESFVDLKKISNFTTVIVENNIVSLNV